MGENDFIASHHISEGGEFEIPKNAETYKIEKRRIKFYVKGGEKKIPKDSEILEIIPEERYGWVCYEKTWK